MTRVTSSGEEIEEMQMPTRSSSPDSAQGSDASSTSDDTVSQQPGRRRRARSLQRGLRSLGDMTKAGVFMLYPFIHHADAEDVTDLYRNRVY